jgi:hypothetical protein
MKRPSRAPNRPEARPLIVEEKSPECLPKVSQKAAAAGYNLAGTSDTHDRSG